MRDLYRWMHMRDSGNRAVGCTRSRPSLEDRDLRLMLCSRQLRREKFFLKRIPSDSSSPVQFSQLPTSSSWRILSTVLITRESSRSCFEYSIFTWFSTADRDSDNMQLIAMFESDDVCNVH